jgi:hypothetical protein
MKPFDHKERTKNIQIIDFKTRQENLTDEDFKKEYLNSNAINLELNQKIYRIFDYNYFLSDLKEKHLTLVKPNCWQDPFENLIMNSTGILKDGREVSFEPIREHYYAQCWSLNKECDGLWRNYKGQNEFAIKVKTNINKLFNSIYNIHNKFHYLSYFIGKVEYFSDVKLKKYIENKFDVLGANSGIEFAETLLIKRKSFNYEKEVRLIIRSEKSTNNLLQVDCDLNDFIEEIIFDPWVKEDIYKQRSDELKKNGYLGKISRSKMYDKINLNIQIE